MFFSSLAVLVFVDTFYGLYRVLDGPKIKIKRTLEKKGNEKSVFVLNDIFIIIFFWSWRRRLTFLNIGDNRLIFSFNLDHGALFRMTLFPFLGRQNVATYIIRITLNSLLDSNCFRFSIPTHPFFFFLLHIFYRSIFHSIPPISINFHTRWHKWLYLLLIQNGMCVFKYGDVKSFKWK